MRIVQRPAAWLSDEARGDVGDLLGVTVEELDCLATFDNMLFRRPVGRHVILICDSFACWSLGYDELRAAPRGAARHRHGRDHARRALHAAADRLPRRLRPRPGDDGRRRPARPPRRRRASTRSWSSMSEPRTTRRRRTRPAGNDPMTGAMRADGAPLGLDDYGRPAATRRCAGRSRELEPADVTKLVIDSSLRGRGGAGFSTGASGAPCRSAPTRRSPSTWSATPTRWSRAASRTASYGAQPAPADRGHGLARYAIQASAGYIFLRGQYDGPYAAVERRDRRGPRGGYLGEHILGTDFSLDIYLHVSIGRYMCGEASAMLNALESKRPNPRSRPPHMASAGLWAKPTVVNNVESLLLRAAHRAHRRRRGGEPARSADEGGTKIYGVAGRVQRPGWWSCRWARRCASSSRSTPAACGRLQAARRDPRRRLERVHPRDDIDVPMDFDHMRGRQPAGHGHARRCSTTRPARSACCSTWSCSSPRSRAAGARPAGRACPGWRRAARHRGGPRHAERPRPARRADAGPWARTCASATSRRAPRSRWSGLQLFRDDFEAHIARGAAPTGAAAAAAPVVAGGEPR